MPATNFDLAPPPVLVDGLAAVPIDIQRIRAKLAFDGASGSGSGEATLEFVLGPDGGCPIFDLRQTVTAAWLDGVPLPVAKVGNHDFGGGQHAQLRIVDAALPAGSAHTLRVSYLLGPPQASTAGTYQPRLTWDPGPRLVFNFGFTDLGAGRYLEAWVPANLIFDQFELELELEVTNTPVPHAVITNGAVTFLGTNHWTVAFPARFTALSPLLELRAADTLTTMTSTATLPVSGSSVTVEAWKLTTNPVDLAAELTKLEGWLAANEASTGPYLHGGRFVAFVHVGGMEYDGGTTSDVESLRHETFHSWYGRGLKPAGQPHGWWDEAWDVYNEHNASGLLPFDFHAPPIELSTSNPWSRVTPRAAYTSGERFFMGVASLIGLTGLKSHMRAFYVERNARPATTGDLEAFLVCRSGEPELVDAFHRFVYGLPDPVPAPDLWIKDDPGDPGGNTWAGRFWDSPDLWIRNADDGGTSHQPVRHGQDNWFHARVRNRSASSTARHFLVTFNVKPWAGVQFTYPTDFLPGVAAAAGFELGPGESAILKARWPASLVPPAGTHVCWLAAVLARFDQPGPGPHVWEHGNLAQKNLTVVGSAPGGRLVVQFVVNRFGPRQARTVTMELVRPEGWKELEASIVHPLPVGPPSEGSGRTLRAAFEPGRTTTVPLRLDGGGQLLMGLELRTPRMASPGSVLRLDLLQHDERRRRPTGGLAIELQVLEERDVLA